MKLTKVVFFTACIILFTNCEQTDPIDEIKEDQEDLKPEVEPEQESTITYFTLNRASAFADEENWLVIHNQDGTLLDYKKFERGDSLVFEALESQLEDTEELTITLIGSNVGPNNGIHSLKTYTRIGKESVWDQEAESTNGNSGKIDTHSDLLQSKLGQESDKTNRVPHNISVSNVPGIERYSLTSKEHYTVVNGQIPLNSTTLNIDEVELHSEVEYLLSIEDGEGNMKYHFLFAPLASGEINLDYSDFLEYDNILSVELPENSSLRAEVTAYDEEVRVGTPLLISLQSTGGPSDAFARFGYIADFKEYDTYFSVKTLDDYGYGYEELGKIPDSISVMPKPGFTVHDTSVEGFNFEMDVNYLRSFSAWSFIETLPDNSINQTQWHVYAPSGNTSKIGVLPLEILDKYPSMNLDKLNYLRTDLILKGRTYEDVLNIALNSDSIWPAVYEWVTFYNPEY